MRGAPGRHYDRCVPGEIKTLLHVACPKAFLQSLGHVRRFATEDRRTLYGFDSQRYVYDIVSHYQLCVKCDCKTLTASLCEPDQITLHYFLYKQSSSLRLHAVIIISYWQRFSCPFFPSMQMIMIKGRVAVYIYIYKDLLIYLSSGCMYLYDIREPYYHIRSYRVPM